MTLLQIYWNGGEFFKDLFGTFDVAIILTGVFFASLGIGLSLLVPDSMVPLAFRNTIVGSIARKLTIGVIVTGVMIRFVFIPFATANLGVYILCSFAIGFLNYHATSLLINIGTGALTMVTNKIPKSTTDTPISTADKTTPDAGAK